MIGTLAWKEYREQRSVWLALAVLGIVLMVVLDPMFGPSSNHRNDVLGGILLVVAFTYGLVCGAMLLAGERESKTLPFLDYLEGRRARIWRTKVVTGLLLTLAQGLLLAGLATALGIGEWNDNTRPPAALRWMVSGSSPLGIAEWKDIPGGWFAIAAIMGLAGFTWGLLGSALCRGVLAAVAVGAALLFVAVPIAIAIGTALIIGGKEVGGLRPQHSLHLAMALAVLAVTVAALAGSWLKFCGPDWQRRPSFSRRAALLDRTAPSGMRAVVWLTFRQGWVGMLVLAGAGLFLGAIVPRTGLVLWPIVTLLLGVGCGMAVFAGEQAGEAQRFLGDQRLPMGRIWAVKTFCWLVVMLALATLMLLIICIFHLKAAEQGRIPFARESNVVQNMAEWIAGQENMDLIRHTGSWTFLLLGLAYGFCFGQFFALITRKNSVAVVLAVLVGLAVIALWVPSLVSGGVRLWQVLVVPAVLLASIQPVLWAWGAGRLHTVRPMLILAGCGALAGVWMAGTFWYRAVAIPDVGEPFDVRAFTASLPTWEQNEAGRLIRKAAKSLEDYEKEISAKLKPPPNPQGAAPQPGEQEVEGPGAQTAPARSFLDQTSDVVLKGWPKNKPVLGRWLDLMFEGEWAAQYREAGLLPLGMVVDLREVTPGTLIGYVSQCREAADLFTARGLQLQVQGNPQAALEHFGVALGLSRQLRHKALTISYRIGVAMQGTALGGIEIWLRELGPRPEMLQGALKVLNRHENQLPPFTDYVKADYLKDLNGRESRTSSLGNTHGYKARGLSEVVLFDVASKVPWEEDRETRMLRVLAKSALQEAEVPLWEKPASPELPAVLRPPINEGDLPPYLDVVYPYRGWGSAERMRQVEARSLCQLRGTRLQIALALYEVEKGKPAATLEALVPTYLPGLPPDPYSGQSFHYRVSKGETIEKENIEIANATLKVHAGQGIIWSVGPDGIDNGGRDDGSSLSGSPSSWSGRSLDWVFLVPPWQKAER